MDGCTKCRSGKDPRWQEREKKERRKDKKQTNKNKIRTIIIKSTRKRTECEISKGIIPPIIDKEITELKGRPLADMTKIVSSIIDVFKNVVMFIPRV